MVCPWSTPILFERFICFGHLDLLFGLLSIYFRSKCDSLAFVFLCFQWDIFMNSLIPIVPGPCLWAIRSLINKRYHPFPNGLEVAYLFFHYWPSSSRGGLSEHGHYLVETILLQTCAPPETWLPWLISPSLPFLHLQLKLSLARKNIVGSLSLPSLERAHVGWTSREHAPQSLLWIQLREPFPAWNTFFFIMFCFSVLWKMWSRCFSVIQLYCWLQTTM